jgi:hypothetical protein
MWEQMGGANYIRYFLTGVFLKYGFSDRITVTVVDAALKWPAGAFGWLQGLLGHRIYMP